MESRFAGRMMLVSFALANGELVPGPQRFSDCPAQHFGRLARKVIPFRTGRKTKDRLYLLRAKKFWVESFAEAGAFGVLFKPKPVHFMQMQWLKAAKLLIAGSDRSVRKLSGFFA